MEGSLEKSPQLGCPEESMEAKYISGLSTVLVASVQEAKDRISQIEYVFCSQLYPHFQAKSKTLQKLYTEARESAENDFKEKEKDLLLQIEKLQQEKQQLCDEISFLKLETGEFHKIGLSPNGVRKLQKEFDFKVKLMADWSEDIIIRDGLLENKTKQLDELIEKYFMLRDEHQREVEELKKDLANQTKVVDAGMYLHNKLLQMIQSDASLAVNNVQPLEDPDKKAKILLGRVGVMINKIAELQDELREKTEEVERGREVQENLLKKVELQATEIMEYEQQSNEYEKEKRLLTTKVEGLKNDINLLRQEIKKKNGDVEQGRKLQEQLIRQIDLYNLEKVKTGQEFEALEKEKKQLLAKLGGSEEKPDRLQANVQERGEESSQEMELHSKLLQQIEAKDSQLMFEKQKRRDVIVAYKKLKSQYNFLCSKYGLTRENVMPQNKGEEESGFWRHNQSILISAGKSYLHNPL